MDMYRRVAHVIRKKTINLTAVAQEELEYGNIIERNKNSGGMHT